MIYRLYDDGREEHYLIAGRVCKDPTIDSVGSKKTRMLRIGVNSSYAEGSVFLSAFGRAADDLEHVNMSDTVVLEYTQKVAVREDGQPIMAKNGSIVYNRTVENVIHVRKYKRDESPATPVTSLMAGLGTQTDVSADVFGDVSSDDLPF